MVKEIDFHGTQPNKNVCDTETRGAVDLIVFGFSCISRWASAPRFFGDCELPNRGLAPVG